MWLPVTVSLAISQPLPSTPPSLTPDDCHRHSFWGRQWHPLRPIDSSFVHGSGQWRHIQNPLGGHAGGFVGVTVPSGWAHDMYVVKMVMGMRVTPFEMRKGAFVHWAVKLNPWRK